MILHKMSLFTCINLNNKKTQLLINKVIAFKFRDLDWIQTSNLLSRNQVRYSIAPRGLNAGANIGFFGFYANQFFILFKKK